MSVLAGDVTLPGVGAVPRKVIIPVVAAAGGYVAWRWYQASAGYAGEDETTDPGFDDPGALPSVAGAVREDNAYGLEGEAPSVESYGFTGTTNAQWSDYVSTRLSQSETWSYTAIISALGAYLAGRALSTEQQQIVQAAIAVGGRPPVGTFTIIPGGDTKVTVAPTGLKVTKVTATSVTLSWSAVAGATGYRVYRSGAAENVGSSADTTATVGGLQPGTSYTFSVAAEGMGSAAGPKSASVTAKTTSPKLAAPTGLRVSATTRTTATLSWGKVAGATFYRLYVNGLARGVSEDTTHTVGGLKPKTRYTITVKADNTTSSPGPAAKVTATTKK